MIVTGYSKDEGFVSEAPNKDEIHEEVDEMLAGPLMLSLITGLMLLWCQLIDEKHSLLSWSDNMKISRVHERRVNAVRDKIRHSFARSLHHQLYLIEQWYDNCMEWIQMDRKSATPFAAKLTRAVDSDGDGGLSLCELKAFVVSARRAKAAAIKASEYRNQFDYDDSLLKAALWLMNGRNFQLYDVEGIWIIGEVELIKAMVVFLRDHWKYDGILW